MERKWNRYFEGVLAKTAVVVADVHKKGFLVGQVEVVFKFGVYQLRPTFSHSLLQEVCHLNLFPLCPDKVSVCADCSVSGAF